MRNKWEINFCASCGGLNKWKLLIVTRNWNTKIIKMYANILDMRQKWLNNVWYKTEWIIKQ